MLSSQKCLLIAKLGLEVIYDMDNSQKPVPLKEITDNPGYLLDFHVA